MKTNLFLSVLLSASVACCNLSLVPNVNAATLSQSSISNIKAPLVSVDASYNINDLINDVALQIKLQRVMNGEVKLFTNDNGTFPLGSRLNNSKNYKVGTHSGNWQCYAYGQAVFYYITGDFVGHGTAGSHSKKVITNKASVSYSLFVNSGVKSGSYLRTTANSNGSYNGNKGHSLIIISYDSNNITILEGNGDGNGLVRSRTLTWSSFNKTYLSNKGYRVSHVISPK